TPEEVLTAPKPLLVHLNTPQTGQSPYTDHFTVVTLRAKGDALQLVDTTNGIPSVMSMTAFARSFSGYCLLVKRDPPWHGSVEGLVSVGTLVLLILANYVTFIRRSQRGAHASGVTA